jgi:hypothetical protein
MTTTIYPATATANVSGNIIIPNGATTSAPVSIPIRETVSSNNFTSSGDFTLDTVFNYYNNFTIASGHKMTLPEKSLRVIYAAGTVTIGGNGIDAEVTSVAANTDLTTIPDHWHFIQNFLSVGGTGGSGDGADGTGYGAGGEGGNSGGYGAGGASFIAGTADGSGSCGGGGAGAGGASAGNTGGAAGDSKLITLIIIADSIIIDGDIDLAGSNGANGATNGSADGGGGGGGGLGGNLLLFANTITHTSGTVSTSGGDGGDGGAGDPPLTADGGGGGGGHSGKFYWQAETITLTAGTRTAAGGAAGAGATAVSSRNGGDGTAGYGQGVVTSVGNPF